MTNKPKLAVGDCVAGLFNDNISNCVYTASKLRYLVNNKLEILWKETVVG